MKTIAVEPCPRCHSNDIALHVTGVAQVICKGQGCGLSLVRATVKEALDAWNWRSLAQMSGPVSAVIEAGKVAGYVPAGTKANALSSSGRTAAFEAANAGSNPAGATKRRGRKADV